MEQIISEEKLKEFATLNGEVRGVTLKAYGEFILKEEGEQGLKKLEEALSNLGYSIKFKEMKTMGWFPLKYQAITIETIKNLFSYDSNKFQEIGRFSAKFSLLVKMFMKYFFSKEQAEKTGPKIWKRSYTVGEFKVVEYNEEKKYAILRIENLSIHPLHGQVLIGYFASIFQMVAGQRTRGEERKCIFKGDDYHEFLMKW